MPEPPIIPFGRAKNGKTWWALLPSSDIVRRDGLTPLLAAVEDAMARDHPGRPFSFWLGPTPDGDPPGVGSPSSPRRGPDGPGPNASRASADVHTD
jgi:hypothetical protein